MTTIRGLKQKIGHFKNMVEDLNEENETITESIEEICIKRSRECLERAKLAYSEAGRVYIQTKMEEKAADFDANMYAIHKISFSIGGYFDGYCSYIFDGYCSYIVEISEKIKAYTKLWEDEKPLILWDYDNSKLFKEDTLISALRDLHIGEWRRSYSTKRFGYMLLDGTQWDLEFEYNNEHKPVNFDGDNSYPYNFDKFQKLFGINATEEDDDE